MMHAVPRPRVVAREAYATLPAGPAAPPTARPTAPLCRSARPRKDRYMSRETPYAASPAVAAEPRESEDPDAPPAAPDRSVALWIVCVSHTFNHLQGNIGNLPYPLMMTDLGFGYFPI